MSRLPAVDLVRGLALLFILIDHIPGSPASGYTLRNFALCDATELFVFLAGLGSAAAFAGMAATRGVGPARRRFWGRAVRLHLVHVAVAAALTGVILAARQAGLSAWVVGDEYVDRLAADPLGFLAAVASFGMQPNLADILPIYVLFSLAAPFVVPAAAAMPVRTLAMSFAAWLAAPWLAAVLPSNNGHEWFLNPFGWQILFVTGAIAMLHGARILPALMRHATPVTALAAAIAALAAALAWSWRHPEVDAVLRQGPLAFLYPIGKADLAALRILSFLSLAWLACLALRGRALRLAARWLHPLMVAGRNALPCFAFGILVSAGVHVGVENAGGGWWIRMGGDLAAAAIFFAIAYAADARRQRARRAVAAPAAALLACRTAAA